MKKISVLIPCYNEQENVEAISKAVLETLTRDLPQYDYELVFIDNDSTDDTRPILRRLCAENRDQGHFNARNFSQFNSPYYGMLQVTGDCVIEMVADFQDPVDMIPKIRKRPGKKATRSSSASRPAVRKTRSCTHSEASIIRPSRSCLT